jgi:hypothetical protein
MQICGWDNQYDIPCKIKKIHANLTFKLEENNMVYLFYLRKKFER